MKIGLLLPRGAGPGDLSRSGQWSRFARHYLRSYRAAFDNVVLLVEEPVRDLGSSLEGIEVRLLRRRWGRWHADSFSDLDGVRAFQAPDLAAMPGSPPVAAATYGYDYSQFARLERRPWRRLRASRRAQRGARRAALLFTPAPFLEDRVLNTAPGARSEHLPNGADLSAFTPSQSLDGVRRALFVGRLAHQKDLQTLLRALALLPREIRPPLTLVGDGPLRGSLESAARRLRVQAEFTGTLCHDHLPEIYRRHQLLLLASRAEGQCKVLLEGMACGLACVVSDCEGNRTLIEDGRSGWLFRRGDARDLANAIRRVLELDPPALLRVRRQARLAVEQRHDLSALLEREITLLRELCESARGGTLDRKYVHAGAYHWRETDDRDLRDFNLPLKARYRVLLSMGPRKGGQVLDAGCGDGALSAALSKRAQFLVGCDPSLRALRLAKRRVAAAHWVCGRVEALPFREACFEQAVAADVLEHVEDATAASLELARVLTLGGDLLASAPVAEPGALTGRFHRSEFHRGELPRLLRREFHIEAVRHTHPAWVLRLYRARIFGCSLPKRCLDLLGRLGLDLCRLPVAGTARQATVRARRQGPRAPRSETSAIATQVAGAMKRKCG
ncbi:MAG: glycosyltransferase [Acidobacteriota bacterium]